MTIRGKALHVRSFSGQRDSSPEGKERLVNRVETPLLRPVTSCWRARLSLSTTRKRRAKSSTAACSRTSRVLLETLTAHLLFVWILMRLMFVFFFFVLYRNEDNEQGGLPEWLRSLMTLCCISKDYQVQLYKYRRNKSDVVIYLLYILRIMISGM